MSFRTGSAFNAEFKKDLNANNAKIADPVNLEVRADVLNPVTHAVLIPKKAKLLARVSQVDAPKDKKAVATLTIAISGAEWKGGFAKLNVVTLFCTRPSPGAASPMMAVSTRETQHVVIGSGGGVSLGTPSRETTLTQAPSSPASPSASNSLNPWILDGKVVFPSSDRLLPQQTVLLLQNRASETCHEIATCLSHAESGDAEAQFHLASMYYAGNGVSRDYIGAAEWYRRAAEQGLAKAQNNLAVLYAEGQGVPQDYIASYMWFDLAAPAMPGKNAANLTLLEGRMTPEQIAEGRRRAEEWQKQHPPSH